MQNDEFLRDWFKNETELWGDYLGQYGKRKETDWNGKVLKRPVMRFNSLKKNFYSLLNLDKDTKELIKFLNNLK